MDRAAGITSPLALPPADADAETVAAEEACGAEATRGGARVAVAAGARGTERICPCGCFRCAAHVRCTRYTRCLRCLVVFVEPSMMHLESCFVRMNVLSSVPCTYTDYCSYLTITEQDSVTGGEICV